MINGKTVLVTICARGGSKGIPNKNLKVLGGKPLILWTLDLLPETYTKWGKYVDEYIISSDSDEILQTCKNHLYDRVLKRPAELANDTVSRVEAIKHATEYMELKCRKRFDIICDLGVATPFKTAVDVNACIEQLEKHNMYSRLTSVFDSNHNPFFDMAEMFMGDWRIVKQSSRLYKKPFTSRQQAQQTRRVLQLNDAVNVWTREGLFGHDWRFDIYEMPPERSVHVDTPLDWAFAEFLLEKQYIQ